MYSPLSAKGPALWKAGAITSHYSNRETSVTPSSRLLRAKTGKCGGRSGSHCRRSVLHRLDLEPSWPLLQETESKNQLGAGACKTRRSACRLLCLLSQGCLGATNGLSQADPHMPGRGCPKVMGAEHSGLTMPMASLGTRHVYIIPQLCATSLAPLPKTALGTSVQLLTHQHPPTPRFQAPSHSMQHLLVTSTADFSAPSHTPTPHHILILALTWRLQESQPQYTGPHVRGQVHCPEHSWHCSEPCVRPSSCHLLAAEPWAKWPPNPESSWYHLHKCKEQVCCLS